MMTLKLPSFCNIMRRQVSLEKAIVLEKMECSSNRGRLPMRCIDSIQEAIGMMLQELSRAFEDRTLWTSLIRRFARSRGNLNGLSAHVHTDRR